MHEHRIVTELIHDLLVRAKEQGARRITAVYIRMGVFSEIDEETVRFYFSRTSPGTILAGASVNIEKSSARELSLLSFDYE